MGLEPTRLTTHGPQPCLSTNFSTRVEKKPSFRRAFQRCDLAGARTQDPLLKREMLYQLSYQIIIV